MSPAEAAAELLARAQALTADKRFADAVSCLSQGVRAVPAPGDKLMLARSLMQLLIQLGQAARARLVLDQVQQWAPSPPDWLADLSFSLSPAWEQPLQGPALRLRRLVGDDAAWLKALFTDEAFAARVNRDYGQRVNDLTLPQVAQQLEAQAKQLPVDMGAHVLVIEQRSDGARLGLACLVAIDAGSRRAEFIIGFAQPERVPSTWVAETGALMLALAFQRLCMHRVTASLYSDNPRLASLMASLCALGFAKEGVQRQHLRLPDGRHVDLHLLGALRDEVLSQPLAARLIKRYTDAASSA